MKKKRKSIFKWLLDIILFLPRWLSSWLFFWRKSKKKKSLNQSTAGFSNAALSEMEWPEFEAIVYGIFKQRGYTVSGREAGAFDGVDLILKRNKETTYVQCQHWKDQEVEITTVSEFYVAMEMDGVKHGIVISSGEFSPDAIDFSLGKSLMLINGIDLSQMIKALKLSAVS